MYNEAYHYSPSCCSVGASRVVLITNAPTGTDNLEFEIRPRFGNGWIKPAADILSGGAASTDYDVTIHDADGNQVGPTLELSLDGDLVPDLHLKVADPDSDLIVDGRLSVWELIRVVNLDTPGAATGLVYLELWNPGTADDITSLGWEWEAA